MLLGHIRVLDSHSIFWSDGQSNADVQVTPITRTERDYTGVLSDYDFREWNVERMQSEAARIMRMMNTTYDQVRGGGEGREGT